MAKKPTYEELKQMVKDLKKDSFGGSRFEREFKKLTSDLIGLGKLDGYFTKVNSSFMNRLGYFEEEFYKNPFLVFIHEDDIEKTIQALTEAATGEQEIYIENRYKHKDGSYRWIDWKILSYADENRFFAVGRDITQRKQDENLLIKSEDKYRTLTQVSPSGIWQTDSNGMNTYVSKRWSKITGISAQKALSRGWSNGIHPDDIEMVTNGWYSHAETDESYRSEFRFIKPNGDIVWVLCIANKLSDQKGWVGTITDITARKSAEEALKNSHETLEQKVEERTKALNDMNAALTVLLKKRDEDKNETERKIISNYKSLIIPFLEKLKNSLTLKDQRNRMMILESNLKEFLEPFSQKLSDPLVQLSPAEIQIASMIKQGLSNKEMAKILNNSIRTITNHRQHIRTKLKLKNKKINLRSYLSSL